MVCTNPNCRKDCPYADAPNPRTFKCYECKLISEIMGASKPKPVPGTPRPVQVGDKVRRYRAGGEIEMYTVSEVWSYEFSVTRGNLSPTYTQHCVKGRFPYWEHEDGSPIIPPPKR